MLAIDWAASRLDSIAQISICPLLPSPHRVLVMSSTGASSIASAEGSTGRKGAAVRGRTGAVRGGTPVRGWG